MLNVIRIFLTLIALIGTASSQEDPQLGSARVVFQVFISFPCSFFLDWSESE